MIIHNQVFPLRFNTSNYMSDRKRQFDEEFSEPVLLDWDFKTTHAISKRKFPEIEDARAEFEAYFGHPVRAAQISTIFLRYGFIDEEQIISAPLGLTVLGWFQTPDARRGISIPRKHDVILFETLSGMRELDQGEFRWVTVNDSPLKKRAFSSPEPYVASTFGSDLRAGLRGRPIRTARRPDGMPLFAAHELGSRYSRRECLSSVEDYERTNLKSSGE